MIDPDNLTARQTRKLDAAFTTAHAWAKLATCPRLAVGAVIMGPNFESVSWGYNGAAPGALDCDTIGCDMRPRGGRPSCHRAIHAEENAIRFAERGRPYLDNAIAVVTHHPCPACANRLFMFGVKTVFYAAPYEGSAVVAGVLADIGIRHFRVST